jgi:hypothetical protein
MNLGKNDYVTYKFYTEKLYSYMLRTIGVRPQNPLVEFYKGDGENLYFIRILAIIPSEIEHISVSPPEARQLVKTHLDAIETRTITIQWKENIPPTEASALNLWAIDLEYSLIDVENGDDKAINVIFQYDTAPDENGDIGTKLSRGTVTTSGIPPSSES